MNGVQNSLLKFHTALLQDAAVQCSTTTLRDIETVAKRVEHEGVSFLTITLPSFCQGFDQALSVGRIAPDLFPAFKARRKGGPLPAFLQGLVELVFNLDSGVVYDEPSYTAILFIRTICRYYKKLEVPCTSEKDFSAMRRYLECDGDLRGSDRRIDSRRLRVFNAVSGVLWGPIEAEFALVDSLIPRHGPGATAERVRGNQKYLHRSWPRRLNAVLPADSMLYLNATHCLEEDLEILEHSPKDEPPVRVVTVPKTASAPRIIAIEPVAMQYAQQSVLQRLVPCLENHPYVGGHLNFTDQTVNQRLALQSSKDRSLATIDLSEASDRVSSRLVREMLSKCPTLRSLAFATRSTRANVPGFGIHPLRKFASMGSALCFPIESMCFLSIILSARIDSLGTRVTPGTLRQVLEGVYVYGDDIIIPTDVVDLVIDWLEGFGLKVNAGKSHWRGFFRESCGVDAYRGEVVTPPYFRHLPPLTRRDATSVVSMVSHANQLYKAGMWRTAQMVRTYLERVIRLKLPVNTENFGGLCWETLTSYRTQTGWDPNIQVPLAKTLVIRPKSEHDAIDGYPALLKWNLLRVNPRLKIEFERRVTPGALDLVPRKLSVW